MNVYSVQISLPLMSAHLHAMFVGTVAMRLHHNAVVVCLANLITMQTLLRVVKYVELGSLLMAQGL